MLLNKGIFDSLMKGVTNILTAHNIRDIVVQGAKLAAKSAGDKAGSDLVEKAFDHSTAHQKVNLKLKLKQYLKLIKSKN